MVWSIKAAIYSSKIDKIIISTDDEEAAEIAQDYSVEVLMRPKKLASDTASTFDVLNYVFCTQLKDNDISPQTVVLLQATSPLRENDLIDKGMKKFQQEKDADRLIELNQLKLFGSVKSGEWVADFPEDTRAKNYLYFLSKWSFVYLQLPNNYSNRHQKVQKPHFYWLIQRKIST